MDAQTTVGICCRVWLPDAVLPAGQSLRLALEGVNGSNFAHLRTKYPSAEFKVFGAASLALPSAQRLHVAARCRDLAVLEQLEVDVLDLAETACDVVADTLKLTDDQVQECFEKIRIEKHDTYFNPVAVAPRAGSGRQSAGPPGAVSKAMPRPPSLDQFTLPQPQPLTFPPLAPPVGGQQAVMPQVAPLPTGFPGQQPAALTVLGSTSPMLLPATAGMQPQAMQAQAVQGLQQQAVQQQAAQQQRQRQQQQQQTAQQMMPPPAAPPAKEKRHKSKANLDGRAETSKKKLDPQQVQAGEQPRADKKRSREDAAAKEARKARKKLEAATKLEAAAFAAELRVPAPAPQASLPQQAEQRQAPQRPQQRQAKVPKDSSLPPGANAEAAAPVADASVPEKPPEVASPPPTASSSPAAPEAIQPPGDPHKSLPAAQGAEMAAAADAGDSMEGSEESSEEGSSSEEEDEVVPDNQVQNQVATVVQKQVKLFKLGDLCCDVSARLVSGNAKGEDLLETMHIDQRVKVERCSEHFQWAGNQATVWRLTPVDETGRAGYYALSEYFLDKGRVGLVETKWYAVYILPAALGKDYLAGLGITGTRRLVGLQVPTALTQ